MSTVTLDFSKAQPLPAPVTLDFSKAQPIPSGQEQQQPGFWENLGHAFGIGSQEDAQRQQDFKDHPIRTMAENALGPGYQAGKAIVQQVGSSASDLSQAAQSLGQGNAPQAALHAINAIPLVGPALNKMADEAPPTQPGQSYGRQVLNAATPGNIGTAIGTAAQAAPMAAGGLEAVDSAVPGRPVIPNPSVPDAIAGKIVPSIGKQQAAGLLQSVAHDANQVPVQLNNAGDAALNMMDWQKKTQLGPTVNKFLNRITNPKLGPMTYEEARDYYQLLGNLSSDETSKLAPPVRRDLVQMVVGLKQDIGDAADTVGRASDYYQGMGDYAQASRLGEWYDAAKKYALPAALGAAGLAGGQKLLSLYSNMTK